MKQPFAMAEESTVCEELGHWGPQALSSVGWAGKLVVASRMGLI